LKKESGRRSHFLVTATIHIIHPNSSIPHFVSQFFQSRMGMEEMCETPDDSFLLVCCAGCKPTHLIRGREALTQHTETVTSKYELYPERGN
jgi:hypothetical protein